MKIVRLVDSEWYIKEYRINVDDYSINLFKHINKNGKLIEKEITFETESFKKFVIYLNEYGFKIINKNLRTRSTNIIDFNELFIACIH